MSNVPLKEIRQDVKELVLLLPKKKQTVFKLMYQKHCDTDNIEDIVDAIPDSVIKWAYQQILNTHMKLI